MRMLVVQDKTIVYKNETYEAILPGMDGEFSILDFHQPLLYRLRKGIIKIRKTRTGPDDKMIRISDGVARFIGNELLVLCEK